jgi:hypothetical protein
MKMEIKLLLDRIVCGFASNRLLFFLTIIFNMPFQKTYGQGCSDAGFCTLNSIKPESEDSASMRNNQMKIGVFYGKGDKSIKAWGNYIEYNHQLSEKTGFDFKITSLAQNGNGITVFGAGDFILTMNSKLTNRFKVTIGAKIPLANGNKTENNISLPMDYQSSLGTFDLITAFGYEINKVQITLALQQPLTQNKNEFIAENYHSNSPIRQFQSTNEFIRSGDILIRVSYPIKLFQNLKLTLSILPIYHIFNDEYHDSGVKKEIAGSRGLTLNGNLFFDYELNQKNSLQLNIGMPFIVRDSRPDGLTRSNISNVEYRFKF